MHLAISQLFDIIPELFPKRNTERRRYLLPPFLKQFSNKESNKEIKNIAEINIRIGGEPREFFLL